MTKALNLVALAISASLMYLCRINVYAVKMVGKSVARKEFLAVLPASSLSLIKSLIMTCDEFAFTDDIISSTSDILFSGI